MKKLFLALVILPLASHFALAEESRDEWILREKAKVSDAEVNAASNASFDKRLPPVIPGEELNDGHSKSKVWSTAGDPDEGEHRRKPHEKDIDDVDIVVDARGIHSKKGSKE